METCSRLGCQRLLSATAGPILLRPPTNEMNSADVTSHGLPPRREYCNLKRLLENRVVQHFLAWELLQAAL